MTVGEWRKIAEKALATIGAPALEAQLLLATALGRDRAWILANPEATLDSEVADTLLERRLLHEPLAYILGWREFYGRRFRVAPGVLIPRHETETLVEAALGRIDEGHRRVLDLGCGSGAIGITLKLERPHTEVMGSDLSTFACELTQTNARALKADIRVVQSDLFAELGDDRFDLIVTNPPYVGRDEPLPPEVAYYEPEEALYADEGGLSIYMRISKHARGLLYVGGEVWVEVGHTQAERVLHVFEAEGWQSRGFRLDAIGHRRVLGFGLNEGPSAII